MEDNKNGLKMRKENCCDMKIYKNYSKERKRKQKANGEVMRDNTFGGVGEQETTSPVLKVPWQCPLVLLVELMHMMGIHFYGSNCLLPFNTTQITQKMKKLGDVQTARLSHKPL
jgi:hypothetical protein